ncbi:uncharacterized protein LOC132201194 [Neocloeon triangulifer]|uniref:uncharacterized protein LOC132201194 n=1 Tax=Neocloeon triangulifer TaxID=2078957 RepID=UPI00286EC292|nr:uncharacterized protein LOC132201194 [Neocloeon triangulifer]
MTGALASFGCGVGVLNAQGKETFSTLLLPLRLATPAVLLFEAAERMSAFCLLLLCVLVSAAPAVKCAFEENQDELQDYEMEDVVGFASIDVDSNLDESENEFLPVNPMIILPLPLPRVAKKALTALARWRPFGSYVEAAASAVAASVAGPEKLDFITAEPRARNRFGREGLGGRQRGRFQPLRFGRRKRTNVRHRQD